MGKPHLRNNITHSTVGARSLRPNTSGFERTVGATLVVARLKSFLGITPFGL